MCYEGVREAQGSQTRYPFGMDETRYNAVINHVNRVVEKTSAEKRVPRGTQTLDAVIEQLTTP